MHGNKTDLTAKHVFPISEKYPHLKFLHIKNFSICIIYYIYYINFTFHHVLNFSISEISPHDKKFSTDNVRGIRDKYEV